MRRSGVALVGTLAVALGLSAALLLVPDRSDPVLATGVGDASWTPAESSTTTSPSRFLVAGDSITYRTEAIWDQAQAEGLAAYLSNGLRYTHEVNDRSGRLSATGYWATNLPDPAYDRDDDDGDGRWEEAEIITGAQTPRAGRAYRTIVQFSRWHSKRTKGTCDWAWDRRKGKAEVLSQLSRNMFGEWQAERYTLTYETSPYERVGARPELPAKTPSARCHEPRPGTGQEGFVITFAEPLSWYELTGLVSVGSGQWTAFEAIGSGPGDQLRWTCGGPFADLRRLTPCRDMGVEVEGVTAATGYFDTLAVEQLRGHASVADVGDLRDSLTGLLFSVGGFGVERPGLTVNDRYWELFLTD